MEPTRKPTVSPTPVAPAAPAVPEAVPVVAEAPALTPTPSPTPAPVKGRSFPSRETRLGAVVAVSFLAVAGGVFAVKHFFNDPDVPPAIPVAMLPPAGLELTVPPRPPSPPAVQKFPSLEQIPPAHMPIQVPEIHLPSQPIQPVRADVPMLADIALPPIAPPPIVDVTPPAPISPPIMEPKKETPLIILDPVAPPPSAPVAVEPIVPPVPKEEAIRIPVKDDFSSKAPKLEALDIPAPPPPEAKNPVIRISVPEAKAVEPPKMEAPPIIEFTPPAPMEMPPKIEIPAFEPPMKKTEAPARIEPIRIDIAPPQPEKKIEAPAVIDVTPRKLEPETTPATGIKKDGEYDEDLHSLKQNESYRLISKQYYNSEAYAIALQRYNRDHPGQADYVRIPPIRVLEKKYAGDVNGTARAVNFTQPVTAEAAPRNEPVYTVTENGEMLAEIARKQLGSEDAWKRIWDLNPQVNPAKAVPGGTRLRMPGL